MRDLVEWTSTVAPEFPRLALVLRLCESTDTPVLLAAAARWHKEAGHACPPHIVTRLRAHLDRGRYDGWESDALAYLSVADETVARPILYARAEKAWKGEEDDAAIRAWRRWAGRSRTGRTCCTMRP